MEEDLRRQDFTLRLKKSKLQPIVERCKRKGHLINTTIAEPKYPNDGKKKIIMDIKTYNSMVETKKNLMTTKLRNMIFQKRFVDHMNRKKTYTHSASDVTEKDYSELTPMQFQDAKRSNIKVTEQLNKKVYNNHRTLNISSRLVQRDKHINDMLPKFIFENFKRGGKIRFQHEREGFLAHIRKFKKKNQLKSRGAGFRVFMKSLKGDLNAGDTFSSRDSFIADQRERIKEIGRTEEYRQELKLRVENYGLEDAVKPLKTKVNHYERWKNSHSRVNSLPQTPRKSTKHPKPSSSTNSKMWRSARKKRHMFSISKNKRLHKSLAHV